MIFTKHRPVIHHGQDWVEKSKYLQGELPKDNSCVIVYCGNGAQSNDYGSYFSANNINGKSLSWVGGTYGSSGIQFVGAEEKVLTTNRFQRVDAVFSGFTVRCKKEKNWRWYCVDGCWHETSADMPEKLLLQEGEDLTCLLEFPGTILLDAQWKSKSGESMSCGYELFSNALMAHSFGGMNGKTYHNTMAALKHGIKQGYRYFEVDLSYTTDKRLVLCHGWSKSNCEHTGFDYQEDFKNMTYDRIMAMKVHGHKIMDARKFYSFVKRHPKYYFEIDFHPVTGNEMKERIHSLLEDFEYDESALDRLLIQAYNKKMYEDIDSVYHFKHYQYLVGKHIQKLDELITYSLDQGICVLAMRTNLAKPEFVRKIRNAGLYVMCYTVNSDLEVANTLLNNGVNTLCTDFITNASLKSNKACMGRHPFYIYYNAGTPLAQSSYVVEGKDKIKKTPSGILEYQDRKIWKNDASRALKPNKFAVDNMCFVGWHMRIKIDNKQFWYCKDKCYHARADFTPGTDVEPYLFEDEAMIPEWVVKKKMKCVMVAIWEEIN